MYIDLGGYHDNFTSAIVETPGTSPMEKLELHSAQAHDSIF
jgi:hypothetical protein